MSDQRCFGLVDTGWIGRFDVESPARRQPSIAPVAGAEPDIQAAQVIWESRVHADPREHAYDARVAVVLAAGSVRTGGLESPGGAPR